MNRSSGVFVALGFAAPPLAGLIGRGLDLGAGDTAALIAGAFIVAFLVTVLLGEELGRFARSSGPGPLAVTFASAGGAAATPGVAFTFVLVASTAVCATLLGSTTMTGDEPAGGARISRRLLAAGGLAAGVAGGLAVVALAAASGSPDAVLAGGLGAAGLVGLGGLRPAPDESRPDADATAFLACRGITVHYGGRRALDAVDLEVGAGDLVALVGTNGAGKTTLLRTISGLVAPAEGGVVFDGADIGDLAAEQRAGCGIAHMAGSDGVFDTLTVSECLRLAARGHDGDHRHVLARLPALDARRASAVRTLSGGERQLLSLAQALVRRPRLLLLDDLSTGLAADALATATDLIREENARGTTVVLVEQSLTLALRLAPRVVFLEQGQIRFDGTPAELRTRHDLLRAVLIPGGES